jgi:uncharacterized membrane protein YcaP (DUF421 family)
MPDWLAGQADEVVGVVGKALLMYLVALFGLRLAHRRTLAQWTAIDFAAAVAVGAIVGRTALAAGQSFLVGATALVTLLAAHTAVTYARFRPWVAKATQHRVRVLVDHGEVRRDQLRRCGLTDGDLLAHLRQQGVDSLAELRYVLYETKGELTVVREPGTGEPDPELVRAGLADATGYPGPG